jgi:acyl-CoA thioesterase-2
MRRVGDDPLEQKMWTKADGALPDDPLLHACVVAYASDMGLVSTLHMRHAPEPWSRRFMTASLDHAMWFHRPFRADDWFLYTRSSPSAHGARGLATGHMYSRDGTLVSTIVQEGLIRPVRPRSGGMGE